MAKLRVLSGKLEGREFQINHDQTVIGRSPTNTVAIDDASVSSRHCSIMRSGRKFILRDLNSTNGTSINEVPVAEQRLNPKDVITVGSLTLLFDGDDIEPYERTAQSAPSSPRTQILTAPGAAGLDSGRFGARRDSKWLWRFVIILLCVLVLGALGWFFFTLFTS